MTFSSSEQASKINNLSVNSLKNFMRAIAVVEKRRREKEEAHDALQKKMAQLKKSVFGKKMSKSSVDKHIAELDKKVNDLLQKEAKLLRSSAFENKTVAELKSKINRLEMDLAAKDSEKESLANINKEKIEAMQAKIDSFLGSKTEREDRIKELENKIRGTVGSEQPDLSEIKDKISKLESKYSELAAKGEHEEEVLDRIRTRIDQLKLNI